MHAPNGDNVPACVGTNHATRHQAWGTCGENNYDVKNNADHLLHHNVTAANNADLRY